MKKGPAVSSVAKRTLSVREVWGSIPGPVKSAQCRQRLATVATFLRSRVAQALSRGDGPRNSLHASAYYGEYNEDLIWYEKSTKLVFFCKMLAVFSLGGALLLSI